MKTIVIATVTAAAMLTGCAGVQTTTANCGTEHQDAAELLRSADTITAQTRIGDVIVKWQPGEQTIEAWRGPQRRYTHAAFRFRPADGSKSLIKIVPLEDLNDQDRVVAVLGVRSATGQLNKCQGGECTYLHPGEYLVDVVMLEGQSPKAGVALGTATVNDRVYIRQKLS